MKIVDPYKDQQLSAIIERLKSFETRLETEGQHVNANIVWLAKDAIEQLMKVRS